MKKIIFSLFTIFSFAIIFSACLDEIELDESIDVEESIAIQASLIKGAPSIVDVFVSRLSNLTGVNLPKAIINAEVSILDENGTELLLDNVNNGYYALNIEANHPSFNIETYGKYQIKIKLVDGTEYLSNLETLLPVPKISSLSFDIFDIEVINGAGSIDIRQNIGLKVNSPLKADGASNKSFLLWELQGTYRLTDTPEANCPSTSTYPPPKTCYVTDKINLDRIVVFDGSTVSVDNLTDYTVYEGGTNFRFAEGYYMTFLQRSLTQDAFTYWKTTNDILQRSGNFFEDPAGKIESNFTNITRPDEEVFGYFYATQQDTSRIYIDPVLVGSPALNCPSTVDALTPPDHCCNCLQINNSTATKPDWWQ